MRARIAPDLRAGRARGALCSACPLPRGTHALIIVSSLRAAAPPPARAPRATAWTSSRRRTPRLAVAHLASS
eukprot:170907-Pyramimonas_sp.AAC.1